MNLLVAEMRRSLKELDLGLKGELTITSDMEDLSDSLFFDQVGDWCISCPCNYQYPVWSGSAHLDKAGLRLPQRPLFLVRRPPAEDQGAGELDDRLQPALLRVAAGLLQPAIFPHGDNAEHSPEE